MKAGFLVLPVLAGLVSSCNMINMVNESTYAIQANREAVEMSTEAIYSNIRAIEESNKAIEENKQKLREINAELTKSQAS